MNRQGATGPARLSRKRRRMVELSFRAARGSAKDSPPQREGRPLMSTASILGPDGVIAGRLAGYETRPQQLEMADAVADALDNKHHLMVEAGTGVGKSFSYLIPAILAA